MDDKIYWNSLNCIPQVGPQTFRKLRKYFADFSVAWKASYQELVASGINPKIAKVINEKRNMIDPMMEWEKMEKIGIKMTTIEDDDYPALLKEISSPPAIIYSLGNWKSLSLPKIAIVGTRNPSNYGREVAKDLSSMLAKENICLVSGLALGIDGIVHKSIIDNDGYTAAVLGSGLNIIHPRTNMKLANEIIEKDGIIISEFPLGTTPLKYHFPIRNRIISGLSSGCVIIEAGQKSGALITARYALEQNREVFAVPGSIYQEGSVGPNNLIKMGARVVTNVSDILSTLNLKTTYSNTKEEEIKTDNPDEANILRLLSSEPIHIDELVQNSGLSAETANAILTMMEIKGLIRNIGGMNYIISK